MRRQDIVVGQMYVYRCKVPHRNLRVYRSTTIEYRVRVVEVFDRTAKVELHYRDGFWIGRIYTVTQRGYRVPEMRYTTAMIGLKNLFPHQEAWVAYKK